jgi:hypothetical protein
VFLGNRHNFCLCGLITCTHNFEVRILSVPSSSYLGISLVLKKLTDISSIEETILGGQAISNDKENIIFTRWVDKLFFIIKCVF